MLKISTIFKKSKFKSKFFSKKKKLKNYLIKEMAFMILYLFRSKYILSYSDIKKSNFQSIFILALQNIGDKGVNFALYKIQKLWQYCTSYKRKNL